MWIKQSDRKGLIEILSGIISENVKNCFSSESLHMDSISGDNIYMIWELNPIKGPQLPNIIIVADGHLRDFLAWASTYFPHYRPFTAYFRVLEFKIAINLFRRFRSPSLDSFETSCLGLIFGETLTLSNELENQLLLSTIGCFSTISYCLSRAFALGLDGKDLEQICDKWSLSRKLLKQSGRKLEIDQIKDIWNTISLIKSRDNLSSISTRMPIAIVDACTQIKEKGEVSNATWARLIYGIEEFKTAQDKMDASREERVRYFKWLLSNNSFLKLNDDKIRSFVCGYLASLIGPGSMSHIGLFSKDIPNLQFSLLWYGLCAGLHSKSELVSSFNVLGRRLLRELLRSESLLGRPSADIAISELEILYEGSNNKIEFRTFSSKYIIIELIPFISTYIRLPRHDIIQQHELFPELASIKLFAKLGSVLDEAIKIQRLLASSINKRGNKENLSYSKKKKKGQRKSIG